MSPARYVILGVFAGIATSAAPVQFQSSERQAALVELYTSEGCSSCPPAESWLSGLKEASGLWRNFVPVAFHVDYWDYLGWRDKWSSKQHSDRQRAYAGVWGSESIYTPEFVLNGKEWHNWLGLGGVPGSSGTKVGILSVTSRDTNHWDVSFIPAAGGTTGYEVNAALLISGVGSDVKAGENAGRHLKHDFVVLKLVTQPLILKNAGFQGAFVLPAQEKKLEGRLALAVWASCSGRPEPVQAVGGWLVPSEKTK
ncbi:MAG TPA: DUF1223 domain-containing protein [Candidatus Acidoferrum sp.]|jgi:hypothetical protein|nr:DUF1223 domain-containing protein [Candidatus Acidoferrum sp.]